MMLALLLPIAAAAQVPGVDTLRLTAEQAAERGAAVSPSLQRERLEVARVRARRIGVGAFFPEYPEVEYSRATDAPFENVGEGTWELGVSQEISLGGESALRVEAADLAGAAAELRARTAELEVRSEARRALARLAAAEARARLVDTLASFARRLDVAAGRLLAAEEISELERNAIAIERGRAEIALLDAAGDVAEERATLAALVGAGVGTVVTAAGTIDTVRIRMALDEAVAVERALLAGDSTFIRDRPDWQALERARERAAVERSIATRRAIPSVRLGLSLESETRPTDGSISGEATRVLETSRLLGFNVGVRVPLPLPGLYDIGRGDVAIAEVEMTLVEAEQRVLESRIRAEVGRAAARLRPSAQALAIYRRDIAPLVERNLELLERGYRAGELGATEVIAQGRQFAEAAEALIEAGLAFEEAYADFELALGRQIP